jgi:hypothetical protein
MNAYDTSPLEVRKEMAAKFKERFGVAPSRLRYELTMNPVKRNLVPGLHKPFLNKYTKLGNELANLVKKQRNTERAHAKHMQSRLSYFFPSKSTKLNNNRRRAYSTRWQRNEEWGNELKKNAEKVRAMSGSNKLKLRTALKHTMNRMDPRVSPRLNFIYRENKHQYHPRYSLEELYNSAALTPNNAASVIKRAFFRHAAPGGFLYKQRAANAGILVNPREPVPSERRLREVFRSGQLSMP